MKQLSTIVAIFCEAFMLVKKKGKVSFVCRTQNGCSTGPISFLWVKLTYFRSQKMFSHDHTTKIEFWGKSWNSCIEWGSRWALTGPGSAPGPTKNYFSWNVSKWFQEVANVSAITLNHPKHHQKSYLNVYACLDFRGPSQHMNFNFFLKNQFWSYEHAKTFVVTGNMSVSLTETL